MHAVLSQPIMAEELDALALLIHRTHRAHLRELRLESVEGGIILTGLAVSYYGKQLAQQEVLHRGLVVLANNVIVMQFTLVRVEAEVVWAD